MRVGFNRQDIDAALSEFNETLDIDREDLDRILRTVEAKALNRAHAELTCADIMSRDVVSVTIYLANVDDWGAMNTVYTEFFASPFPSRTAVGAELRDILVEISAVAYVGGGS